MKTHSKTHILARLESGLRTDAARLDELEQELALVLQRGRGLGAEYGSPGDWTTAWGHHWDQVEIILCRIHDLVSEVQDGIQSHDPERHTRALQTWTQLQIEDTRLEQTLEALHGQAIGLNATAQTEWDAIARTLAEHLNVIHACAEALRIKLELLKDHSSEEVDVQVQKLLARLSRSPQSRSGSTLDNEEEYQQAAVELEREKNHFMGFMDVVKGMFLWVETEEERADKNRVQESV
ncbi:MAG: hypothetical protein B7Z47_02145 [Chthoniobacter sp. 12-60-6]|nr:MAG: hypothetical protein B7Z47_02145 [Chthoniobacter sp. 12-60-6]